MERKFRIFVDTIKEENTILRRKADEICFPIPKTILNVAKEMKQYIDYGKDLNKAKKYKIIQAYGIAAPQLGCSYRMFYFSVPASYNNLEIYEDSKELISHLLVNPILYSYQNIFGAFKHGESCLSVLKDRMGIVKRSIIITIKGYSLFNKKEVIINAKGRLAIILLHELDHLNGILYYDRINKNNTSDLSLKYLY